MNILDVIIILAICPVLINGYRKGFINQAFSIIALIAGAWVASTFAGKVGSWIFPMFESVSGNPETIAFLGGFAITFVVMCLVFMLLGKLLEKIILAMIPDWINNVLGLLLGVVNGLLLLCVLFLLFQVLNKIFFFADLKGAFFSDSYLFPYIEKTAQTVLPNLLNAII